MKQIPKGRRRRLWTDWDETWGVGTPGGGTGCDQMPLTCRHSLTGSGRVQSQKSAYYPNIVDRRAFFPPFSPFQPCPLPVTRGGTYPSPSPHTPLLSPNFTWRNPTFFPPFQTFFREKMVKKSRFSPIFPFLGHAHFRSPGVAPIPPPARTLPYYLPTLPGGIHPFFPPFEPLFVRKW